MTMQSSRHRQGTRINTQETTKEIKCCQPVMTNELLLLLNYAKTYTTVPLT